MGQWMLTCGVVKSEAEMVSERVRTGRVCY